MASRGASVKLGIFVKITSPLYLGWGIGKLLEVSQCTAKVQYFDAPGALPPDPIDVPLSQIVQARLPTQTRVYRRTAELHWQVGRVIEDDGAIIFVQFPNGEMENITAEQLQVRWSRRLIDPLPLLAVEATETPFLADARANFVRAVASQHHAVAGVSAALCSSIDLVDYQFDVVRRVLSDPIQRYLLADEVGLGKTIEAAIIVRQYFIDDPAARAVLIVPPALVYQWRRELAVRFGLGAELDDMLHVIAHDDLKRLSKVIASAGMLVVDEAHHLSKQSTAEQRELYELLRSHTLSLPRLLLLSATPVLGNADEFLRVLHLLDPVVFPLDDLDGFKRRIASRQVIAEVVSTLLPENVWGLGPDLERLLENYPDDPLLVEKVGALKKVLDNFPDEENAQFLAALEDLKNHLVESYRLHRRLLRNRRTAVPWATPRRAGMRSVVFSGEATETWRERLEALRLALAAYGSFPHVYQSLLQAAVHPHSGQSLRRVLTLAGLDDPDLLAQARSVDHAAERLLSDPARVVALCRQVRTILETPAVQVVVFCDRPQDADRVADALVREIGDRVARHQPVEVDEDGEVTAPEWEQFLKSPNHVRVLVCDARAEEGVNLHGGRKVAVHYDLPSSPNRIEQRLGRLDRYGTGDPIVSYVFLDEANSDEAAWVQVLDSGWGVFRQSVASLQYLIESTSQLLACEWSEQGTAALQSHADQLGGSDGWVQHEVRLLNHQDSLDALASREIPGMDALEDADSDWAKWRDAFKALAVDSLQFGWRSENELGEQTTDTPFRVGYAYRDGGKATLLPLAGFLKHFLATVDQRAIGGSARFPLSHQYAFKRNTVTNRRGLEQGLRLLRIGDPLVASLEQFCATDDRGRAFAVWRANRHYEVNDPSGADLYFRFDFMVRPALNEEDEDTSPLKQQAFARKAGTLLAPLAMRVWVHGNGMVEAEPSEFLTSKYAPTLKGARCDFNLNAKRWRRLPTDVKSTWLRNWGGLCESQRDIATAAVRSAPVYIEHIQSALKVCTQERRLRRSLGEARASRLQGLALQQELDELLQAEEMYASLEAAIASPRLDLDVVGAVFLSSISPFNE
ncbi:protein DpdE [Pseudomonas lijiangensis]|uniref:protein DpdE n=1 Tax=Pseudomonas lijiangensis TaxID=2995658 RepID=UPI0031B9F3BF